MPIIVASSNLFRRELSSYILSEAGYTVYEAHDSAALLRCLEQVQPNLVLLDVWLAGANGLDLTQHIRRYGPVPILVISNASALPGSSRSGNGSSNDTLSWPYQSEDLLAHVRALLPHAARQRGSALAMAYEESLSNSDCAF